MYTELFAGLSGLRSKGNLPMVSFTDSTRKDPPPCSPGLGRTKYPTDLEQRSSFSRWLSAEKNENVRGLTFALPPLWPLPCSDQALEIFVKRDPQVGSGQTGHLLWWANIQRERQNGSFPAHRDIPEEVKAARSWVRWMAWLPSGAMVMSGILGCCQDPCLGSRHRCNHSLNWCLRLLIPAKAERIGLYRVGPASHWLQH